MLHNPSRITPEQLPFLHWFVSFCNSSFISWSSNFWMSTWCFIMNFPFKWKTGMSYLYLSYQNKFSGRVISTSCKTNCDRKDVSTSWTLKNNTCSSFDSYFFQKCKAVFLMLLDFFFYVVDNWPFCVQPCRQKRMQPQSLAVCLQRTLFLVHNYILNPLCRITLL